jgi:transcriptional regulator with XRE-family HTH domain
VDEILQRLGHRIRDIRIQRGFKSQEEFADYCKLHRTFVGHLETGRKDFRLTTIIRVAEVLGVTMQDLFAGIETGKSEKSLRNKTRTRGADSAAIARELSALEQSVERLKELYPTPGAKRRSSTEPKQSRRRHKAP